MNKANILSYTWLLFVAVCIGVAVLGCSSLPPEAKQAWQETRHINYRADVGADDWKLPQQFIKDGYGDCEDFALFYYNFLSDRGFKPDFLTGDGHAWVRNYSNGVEYHYSIHTIGEGPLPGYKEKTVNSHNKFKKVKYAILDR